MRSAGRALNRSGRPRVARYVAAVTPFVLLLVGCAEEIVEEVVVRPVKTLEVGAGGMERVRTFPGVVEAGQSARLAFRVSGPLVDLRVLEGDPVSEGDILAQLDPRDFENEVSRLEGTLGELQAQLQAMQAGARPEDIAILEAQLAAAEAQQLEARSNFTRYQRLYENDNVSKAEFDLRRATLDVAVAQTETARQNLLVGQSGARLEDIQAMESRIRAMEAQRRSAENALEDAFLRAPYDGNVAQIFVENFEFVQAQQDVLSIQDRSVVEIVSQIPEAIIAQGGGAILPDFVATYDVLPGVEFLATPYEVATEADPVTRTYSVTFRSEPPEGINILSGMTAQISLRAASIEEGFAVPVAAIFSDEQGVPHVWKYDRGAQTASRSRVQVGDITGDSAIVLDGLAPGDVIVTAGTHFINEGQPLREITDELRDRR